MLICPEEFCQKRSIHSTRHDVGKLLDQGTVTEMGLERLWMESGAHMQRGKDDVQFLIEQKKEGSSYPACCQEEK